MADTQPLGSLVARAVTADQAKALLTCVEAISEKTLRSTVTVTAGRGRGKSAALGLAVSAAISYGYSNIFVTAPSPENLTALFSFICKGFDALGYEEHRDYELIQSSNPDFNRAIVRINVFHAAHRQTVQYVQPQDAHKLGQAELVVVDEAAAIPLPLVRALLGPYLVFLASTIHGYEGTGRSLSIKLLQELRKQAAPGGVAATAVAASAMGSRVLREVTLETPIRYAFGDPVEGWLEKLLCLDARVAPRRASGCPPPSSCELYHVSRDALFSYNRVSEVFLQRLMALYVASHYKVNVRVCVCVCVCGCDVADPCWRCNPRGGWGGGSLNGTKLSPRSFLHLGTCRILRMICSCSPMRPPIASSAFSAPWILLPRASRRFSVLFRSVALATSPRARKSSSTRGSKRENHRQKRRMSGSSICSIRRV